MVARYGTREYYLQNDDDVSSVNGVTGITVSSLISQDKIGDLTSLLQHSVEEAATESKNKRSVAAMSHLQYFMRASNNDLINWEDLTHYHTTQYFWGPFVTYMVKYANNKTRVKFADGNSSDSKKSAKS